MNEEKIKKHNIKNLLFGSFLLTFSLTLTGFFLPFFLRQKGLSALQIGGLFTISIVAGSLFFGVFFSRIIKKIKLKFGLLLAGALNFFETFVLYLFTSTGGAVVNQFTDNITSHVSRISFDVTAQHNLKKGKERDISSLANIVSGIGEILGIALCIILLPIIGFQISFLIFSLISLFSLFFYFKIDDKTRFKNNSKFGKLPKITGKLKLILFSEIIYWLALSSSFSLVITFLVTDKLSGGILQIGLLFIALYGSMTLVSYIAKEKLKNI
ncbi:MAG TPA: hypothetical protein VMC07_00580, partial [Candidatus Omnitrophota bacterium]|nr:hypothetical protein [Candidatus Omnitrophota bacterium]